MVYVNPCLSKISMSIAAYAYAATTFPNTNSAIPFGIKNYCKLIMRLQAKADRENMTEEDIIKLIRTGGKAMDAGVKALYQSAGQPMLRFFVYKGISGDDAKDVLQETFVKIVRSVASFSGDGSAQAWIWQIARNCLTDHQRKQGSLANHETAVNDEQWQILEETTADPTALNCGTVGSIDECVSLGLEKFNRVEPERAMVLILQMDGFSIDEIGLRIGRTTAATKEYLSQCKKKFSPSLLIALNCLRIEHT